MTEMLKIQTEFDASMIRAQLGDSEDWIRTNLHFEVTPTPTPGMYEIRVPDSMALHYLKSALAEISSITILDK